MRMIGTLCRATRPCHNWLTHRATTLTRPWPGMVSRQGVRVPASVIWGASTPLHYQFAAYEIDFTHTHVIAETSTPHFLWLLRTSAEICLLTPGSSSLSPIQPVLRGSWAGCARAVTLETTRQLSINRCKNHSHSIRASLNPTDPAIPCRLIPTMTIYPMVS